MSALLVASKHTGPFYFYSYTTLHALAPWSLVLPGALWVAARSRRQHTPWGFPFVWFSSSFLILSLLSSKQLHYTLLLAAPASLLIGCVLLSRAPRLRRWNTVVQTTTTGFLVVGGLGLLIALAARVQPLPIRPAALCLAAVALAARSFRWRGGVEGRLAATAITLAALLPAALQVFAGAGSHGTAARQVATEATRLASTGATAFCVGPLDATCAFYANQPCRFAGSLEDAWLQAKAGDLILATWRVDEPFQQDHFPTPPVVRLVDRAVVAAAFLKPVR